MTHAEYMREWRRRHPEHHAREVERNRRRYQNDQGFRETRKEQVAAYKTTASGLLTEVRHNAKRRARAREV